MKHRFWLKAIFAICWFPVQLVSNDQRFALQAHSWPMYSYVLLKESLYCYFMLNWWVDNQKVSGSKIYCKNCKNYFDSFWIYLELIGRGQDQQIGRLKKLWEIGTVEQIEQFMLQFHNDTEIPCVACNQFYGWYVRNEIQE